MDRFRKSPDVSVWYCRSIAPLFYLLAVAAAFGTIYFLVRSLDNRERLWVTAECAATAVVAFVTAKFCSRHADKLEREQMAVNPAAPKPDTRPD